MNATSIRARTRRRRRGRRGRRPVRRTPRRRGGAGRGGIEAGDGVGGTWFWNRYPGARCDVESVDYSYSFDRRPRADVGLDRALRHPARDPAYLDHVADRYGLRERLRLRSPRDARRRSTRRSTWTLDTDSGEEYRARFVVMATGCLSAPIRPDLPGVDDFARRASSPAQWPRGRRLHRPAGRSDRHRSSGIQARRSSPSRPSR